ncbi:viaA, partial [Symbiodinium sp. CCMP2456]
EAISAAAAVCGSLAFRRRGWQRACRHATKDCQELSAAVDGLSEWRSSLIHGQVPGDSNHTWPPEPLRRQLLMGIREIDLPMLLSEQPELVDTVLLNVLQAVETFQKAVKASERDSQSNSSPSLWSFLSASTAASGDGSDAEPSEAAGAEVSAVSNSDGDSSEEDAAKAGEVENLQNIQEDQEGQGADGSQQLEADGDFEGSGSEESLAEQLTRQFVETWRELAAEAAKPRLQSWAPSDSAEGSESPSTESFAACTGTEPGTWSEPLGWEHLLVLRKLLGRLPELKSLVKRMGRRSGLKASLRFDRAQRAKSKEAEGVVRSDRSPFETSGITRSDGSLLLLPSELSLLAHANAQPPRQSSAGARALFRLRRAEANLLSYERSAWVEEEAETLKWREFRPAQERGPLICCVDTSRSMAGRREAIAKAAVLEVLMLAEAERRPCYLYFFSGSEDLEELEVPPAPIPAQAWQDVLAFLSRSFGGGTDLETPLAASARRLQEEWRTADILLVTDGEVEAPSPPLLEDLQLLREGGLRVFGLTVAEPGQEESAGMATLAEVCDEVHRFEALGRVPLRWRP